MAAPNLPHPFIYVENLANLRDAGGLTLQHSDSIVAPKILYRSADPTLCTLDEIRYLNAELGITHIFDLRSGPEHEKQGSEVVNAFDDRIAEYNALNETTGTPLQRYWTPVFKNEDYSPESIALRFKQYGSDAPEGFVRAYEAILAHGAESYATILRQIAQPNSGAVLLHCTAGKDRTGVIIAIILSLLGVPRTEICEEYQLTETGLLHRRPHFIERIMGSGAFEGEEGLQAAARMVGARAESMRRTLEMVDEKYGGAEGYVRSACGLSDDEITAVRARLVRSSPPGPNLVSGSRAAL